MRLANRVLVGVSVIVLVANVLVLWVVSSTFEHQFHGHRVRNEIQHACIVSKINDLRHDLAQPGPVPATDGLRCPEENP